MASKEIANKDISKANKDFLDRIRSEMCDFQLDADADIFYVTFGESAEAISIPVNIPGEDVYLRVEPDSLRIVGFEILNFRRTFLPKHADAQDAFKPLFDLLGDMDWRIQLRHSSKSDASQIALLLPAAASVEYFPAYLRRSAPDLVPA